MHGGDHRIARRHRQVRAAQARGNQVHRAEASPAGVHVLGCIDLERQHDHGFAGGVRQRLRCERAPGQRAQGDQREQGERRGSETTEPTRLRVHARVRGIDGSAWFARIRHRSGSRWRRIGGVDRRGRHHPAIAEAGDRAHALLRLAVVADRAAHLHDQLAELRIGDVDASPQRGDQLVVADRTLALLHQVGEAVEHASRQRHQLAVVPQFACRGIEAVVAEAVHARRRVAGSGLHGVEDSMSETAKS